MRRIVLSAVVVVTLGIFPAIGSAPPVAATEIPLPSFDGRLDAGYEHTCALLDNDKVRRWGLNDHGQLGYGNSLVAGKARIGDNETPDTEGPVDFGGPTAIKVAAGGHHSCAILDDGGVRCWGLGSDGRLGYGNTNDVGVDANADMPATVGDVDLGANRTAKAITAGGGHTCAILDNDKVRCWGNGGDGRLGYGNTDNIGDDASETPASVDPVDLGGHTAKAIAAGGRHTCVILDNSKVRCWGNGQYGATGYGSTDDIGDTEVPDTATVGHVHLGGVDAARITEGEDFTCAVLVDDTVRCWGRESNGVLGLVQGVGSTNHIGDDETPDSVPPVDLGGRAAVTIAAGNIHACAVSDTGTVHCWGNGREGALGHANTVDLGDNEAPGSVGRVLLDGLITVDPPPFIDELP